MDLEEVNEKKKKLKYGESEREGRTKRQRGSEGKRGC